MSAYANLGRSGIMRAIEDYALGINFSRALSVKYAKMVKRATPPTPKLKNEFFAFFIGGLVCVAGQALYNIFRQSLNDSESKLLVSVTVIVLTAVLTALHLYEHYAKVAGGGSLVPISGFANAMVSPAMEFKSEGLVLGTGAKTFSIAGPVLFYGICAGVLYGIIYYIYLLL